MRPEELGAWQALLQEEFEKPYWRTLAERVDAAYAASTVYPPREELFAAFRMTPPEAVRVVILGQDPYHEPGQANGLAFSVNPGVKLPPSLRNIYQELESDLGISPAKDGDLSAWARQGVLLLNTVLTVEQGAANAHAGCGWETFTRAALEYAAAHGTAPLAAVLWGKPAQKYAPIFNRAAAHRPVLVLESAHPSPLSAYRGFFGSAPFGKVNAFLKNNGAAEIDWRLPANATHG